jgi:hypothetical protein
VAVDGLQDSEADVEHMTVAVRLEGVLTVAGDAVTVMVADACAVPPVPLHSSVYVVVEEGD